VKPVFLLDCYRCIFHGTGNSARLTSEFRGGEPPTPLPLGTPLAVLKCTFGGYEDACVIGLCVVFTSLAQGGVKFRSVLVGDIAHVFHPAQSPWPFTRCPLSLAVMYMCSAQFLVVHNSGIRGRILNIPYWCRHLYSSCGSAKHRYMVGLPCLVSQCVTLHVAGWTWEVFTRV
jgi:hypothetical protein